MTHYLIEFRFHGYAKYKIKMWVDEVNQRFGLKSKRAIPHITLAGPFTTDDETRLIRDFNLLCSNYSLIDFKVNGFGAFEDAKVIFLDITPSQVLEEFRWNLAQMLKPYCNLNKYDYERKYEFHSTIAMKLPDDKFEGIKLFVAGKDGLKFKHIMVRATLVKDQLILREYDFLLRRPLGRKLALDGEIYTHTLNLLNAYFEGSYNPGEYLSERIEIPKKSMIDNIKSVFKRSRIFVTSDFHLDHTNIIKYCRRPFLDTADMNKTLVQNWNNTINNKDTVYFLGDLAYGRGGRSTDYWLKQLNGNIFFIKGNHDESNEIKFHDNFILEYVNHKFFLTHRPENVPSKWNDWAICGHNHNNNLREYPFIDKENKRINISVELTKYKPVDMDFIIKQIN
ncbi:2'-5' RNA ligase family protein [Methanosarcina sp. 1.H.A.2.2]|uniref:2'-5' RNA ligase family protein n=1 Tax=Methanosarcina sp. 1.H.A.2.2 TaxID=1483601 RepID=UPI000695DA1D|nr:2'-5' RNA ligase family protein [Methanosarcina sp. 1.H.A.2.2]